jgi:uncharacterized protein (DUF952 family)
MQPVYKICSMAEWAAMQLEGRLDGSPDDRRDGFIHLSTRGQVRATAARHFAGRRDLVLLAVDTEMLAPGLRWEASRGGALFPHLYGSLPLAAVIRTDGLPLGADGRHRFPDDVPA